MFKEYIKEFYTHLIQRFINIDNISTHFNNLSRNKEWDDDITGWLIYYPTYLMLHILFIYTLFYNQIRIRNWLIITLVGFVIIDLGLIIVFKQLEFDMLYRICYSLFQKLFGLPFILLAIEGGRHLFKELLTNE